ncbi:hypothetical protein C8J56DRAFT_908905, partial [Mycena floridula]
MAGIVLGPVLVLELLVCLVVWLVRRHYKRQNLAEEPEYPFQNVSQSHSAPVTANPVSPMSPERELPPVSEYKE